MPTDVAQAARISFGDLPAFPDLFGTYTADYDAVAEFYAGDFRDRAARRAAADRAVQRTMDRDALADVLAEQNEHWGASGKTLRRVEALRDPESVAVVTGQQVGLLSGPLYTPLKAITTLQLARRLADETGRPVVPMFWVEGEDHDFEEVSGIRLLRRNDPVTLRYERPGDEAGRPAGRHVLTGSIRDVLDRIDETLPDSDFKPKLMERARAAYQPGTRLEDAFVRFMQALFEKAGLVFVNPDDARLKRATAPLFRREIDDPTTLSEPVRARSEKLDERFHAQVHVRPTNLFLLTDDGREPLDYDDSDGAFRLRGAERTFSENELLAMLDDAPERFSPNVVMRPLMQDALLPTAAYVAGPGEVSYHAQLGPAYDWAEVPQPLVHPRASATLVEGKVRKVLDKFDLALSDLAEGAEPVFERIVQEGLGDDVEAAFGEASTQLHQIVNGLKEQVEAVDGSLAPSVEATRSALAGELDALKGRVVQAEKRNQGEVRAQLDKAAANLFPGGEMQERALNVLYFLNKYDFDLLDRLAEELRPDATEHQVVEL
jgi:bacillithiol biosynthesis cysteine-adding enzyme BshC